MSVRRKLLAVAGLSAGPVLAHVPAEGAGAARLPELLGVLLFAGLLLSYFLGTRRVRPEKIRSLAFYGASLIAALFSFESISACLEQGAAMHMAKHMLIMAVIAPLYVLARPLPQWLAQWLAVSGRAGLNLLKPLLRLGRFPMWTSGLQGISIWFWHTPKFYNLAVANPWWHLTEHVSFALAAGLFWWSVLGRPNKAALPALLFTAMHTGMLGALLTFAQRPLYSDRYDILDQQLAGLIMWVPGGLPYLIACIWCSLDWVRKTGSESKP